ncbi:MAG: DNA mismatch repair protein MutS [Synergistaceae bacterium]
MELPAGVKVTPMLEQYIYWKEQYPDCLLFFRMGDFYEMFFKDAEIASSILDIVLTSRSKDSENAIPMAGVPFHSVDSYIGKLVTAGFRVAICEQITEPDGKTLVERSVTRVITPGTWIPENSDSDGRILSINIKSKEISLALLTTSTGTFKAGTFDFDQATSIITSFSPMEVLLPKGQLEEIKNLIPFSEKINYVEREKNEFSYTGSSEWLCKKWKIATLNSMGFDDSDFCVGCAYVALRYLEETQFSQANHVSGITQILPTENLILDPSTQINLELINSNSMSLYAVLNRCLTPMGKRLLKEMILSPSRDISKISMRQDSIEELVNNLPIFIALKDVLPMCKDMAKSIGRMTLKMNTPSDLLVIKQTLEEIPKIREIINKTEKMFFLASIPDVAEITNFLSISVADVMPRFLKDGGVIRTGYSSELDSWREKATNSSDWLKRYEEKERERTGIKTLKAGVNKVFGYYIEIPKGSVEKVPLEYIRKQTLVNGERFITEDLKLFESDMFSAEEEIRIIEEKLYNEIVLKVLEYSKAIQKVAYSIALIDVFISFADITMERNYVRPEINMTTNFIITGARHPVIEIALGNKPFTLNNYDFSEEKGKKIGIITGPNMAGKSTYLRTAALITIMAHMGMFVPAEKAEIGLVDRVFTRIGAHDELARGQSTFMVEMVETANILKHATQRSLIILDEIGRGTSTYDGLSIAWSVLEFLHGHENSRARVLFATHYHELTRLPEMLPGIINLSMAVEENDDGVLFLHRVIESPSDRSYGIEVARLAGLPSIVLRRSRELLMEFEKNVLENKPTQNNDGQMLLFDPRQESIIEELASIDPNLITPMEALELLYRLKKESIKALK